MRNTAVCSCIVIKSTKFDCFIKLLTVWMPKIRKLKKIIPSHSRPIHGIRVAHWTPVMTAFGSFVVSNHQQYTAIFQHYNFKIFIHGNCCLFMAILDHNPVRPADTRHDIPSIHVQFTAIRVDQKQSVQRTSVKSE